MQILNQEVFDNAGESAFLTSSRVTPTLQTAFGVIKEVSTMQLCLLDALEKDKVKTPVLVGFSTYVEILLTIHRVDCNNYAKTMILKCLTQKQVHTKYMMDAGCYRDSAFKLNSNKISNIKFEVTMCETLLCFMCITSKYKLLLISILWVRELIIEKLDILPEAHR